MKHENVNRRDFSKWTMAALGGLVSGAAIGCSDETATDSKPGDDSTSTDPTGDSDTSEVAAHACRGLNECKSASNDCRGQGTCATTAWHHTCGGNNDCKGQGGCGEKPLQNDCKEQGKCAIPLMDKAWEIARKNMEEKWEKAGTAFGTAPAPKS